MSRESCGDNTALRRSGPGDARRVSSRDTGGGRRGRCVNQSLSRVSSLTPPTTCPPRARPSPVAVYGACDAARTYAISHDDRGGGGGRGPPVKNGRRARALDVPRDATTRSTRVRHTCGDGRRERCPGDETLPRRHGLARWTFRVRRESVRCAGRDATDGSKTRETRRWPCRDASVNPSGSRAGRSRAVRV